MKHPSPPRGAAVRTLLRFLATAVAVMVLSASPHSSASGKSLLLGAQLLLGRDAPGSAGWFGCIVQLENQTDSQLEGVVELVSEMPFRSNEGRVVVQAPFAIAGKGRVNVELPTHGFRHTTPGIEVTAKDNKGEVLASYTLPEPRMPEPLLYELVTTSKLSAGLSGKRVAVRGSRLRGSYGPPMLALGYPATLHASGDLALPTRASGYAPASLVVAKSEAVTRLTGPALAALTNWVLGGGALAIHVSRPEDLRSATLQALVGGPMRTAAVGAELKAKTEFIVPSESSSPYGRRGFGSTMRVESSPGEAVAGELTSYAGGNLEPSPWGASASYGLGEVHLLPFDATKESHVNDPWVQYKLLDLVRHAWTRQNAVAFPHGLEALDSSGTDDVRKVLDPNEGARWAIVVALLLLMIYAVVAGPVNFLMATRRGKPLRALWHLPIWAAGTLILIVGLGTVAKGVVGRSRHLSLIEAGAGMSRGSILRYRGFFASSSEELVVRGNTQESVLDVYGESENAERVLVIDRDGVRLEKLHAKPWQTVVVREDAFVKLGGGVSLVEQNKELVVVNRSARDLRAAIVKLPGGDAYFFDRIADGQTVKATDGKKVAGTIGAPSHSSAAPSSHSLDLPVFSKLVEESVEGGGAAWQALEASARNEVDWWPSDVPVLIAQVEGGEGRSSDSGLKLDSDRVMLRVVGYGGVP
ncbi:MAG: hypothetical protein R3B13_38515 [Polyangiaceae bacterium]